MPHYVQDPDNPDKQIDVIELLRRDLNNPPPPDTVIRLMKRDQWTRQEALLILSGCSPDNQVSGFKTPVGVLGAGIIFLDGTTTAMLAQSNLHHPLADKITADYAQLSEYVQGLSMEEMKAPEEWLRWAESKDFKPYWLDYWRLSIMRRPILYSNAASRLAEMDAGENAWDTGSVWACEPKWRYVLDYLLKIDRLPLLEKVKVGDGIQFQTTKDPKDAWIDEDELQRIFENPPSEPIETYNKLFQEKKDELAAQTATQEARKEAAGRYTITESATLIAKETEEREGPMLEKLRAAVLSNELPVYEPGKDAKYHPKTPLEFYAEVYWNDLNTWLVENEPRIAEKWIFPKPGTATTQAEKSEQAPPAEPVQRQSYQEKEILRVISDMGLDAMALPMYKAGKPSAKADVRKKLKDWTDDVFKKAWKRCRKDEKIAWRK